MIRAADCATSDEPPPPLLSLYWNCERFGTLPEAGGLYDQPAGLLEQMATLSNIYQAHKAQAKAGRITDFADNNPDAFRLVVQIQNMRSEVADGA